MHQMLCTTYVLLVTVLLVFAGCLYFIWNRTEPARELRTDESPALVG